MAKRENERERENGDMTYRKKNVRTYVPTRKLVFKKETLENKEEDKEEDEEDKEETISSSTEHESTLMILSLCLFLSLS